MCLALITQQDLYTQPKLTWPYKRLFLTKVRGERSWSFQCLKYEMRKGVRLCSSMQLGLHVSGTSCSYKPPVLMFPSGRSQGNSTVVEIGKFTSMITLHFQLQPQYNMNFIYVSYGLMLKISNKWDHKLEWRGLGRRFTRPSLTQGKNKPDSKHCLS